MNEDPVDLMSAAQEGFFKLLAAAVTLASVHDHVKQDTAPPFVKIGTIETSSEGSKGDQREVLQTEIHIIYRGADRSALLAIMHEVRVALDGRTPDVAGVEFGTVEFIGGAASEAGPDGVTYAAIATFEVTAEPA